MTREEFIAIHAEGLNRFLAENDERFDAHQRIFYIKSAIRDAMAFADAHPVMNVQMDKFQPSVTHPILPPDAPPDTPQGGGRVSSADTVKAMEAQGVKLVPTPMTPAVIALGREVAARHGLLNDTPQGRVIYDFPCVTDEHGEIVLPLGEAVANKTVRVIVREEP